MTKPTALQWLPQPSTVIGLGTLAGTFCYWITRDPIWAGVAAAAVKILVPDNSTGRGPGVRSNRDAGAERRQASQSGGRATVGCLRRRQKSGPAVPGGTGENDERSDQRPRLVGRT